MSFKVFQAASKACIGSGSVPSGICQMELDTTVVANPCSADHILAGKFPYTYGSVHEHYFVTYRISVQQMLRRVNGIT